MGDRGSIHVFEDREAFSARRGITLYSHWHGSQLPHMLAIALDASRDRWNDAPYLTRQIVTRIVHMADACEDVLSWGLMPYGARGEDGIALDVIIGDRTVGGLLFDAWIEAYGIKVMRDA